VTCLGEVYLGSYDTQIDPESLPIDKHDVTAPDFMHIINTTMHRVYTRCSCDCSAELSVKWGSTGVEHNVLVVAFLILACDYFTFDYG
jgi:hypothetical protein